MGSLNFLFFKLSEPQLLEFFTKKCTFQALKSARISLAKQPHHKDDLAWKAITVALTFSISLASII
jgi:hypothetical protein